MKHPVTITFGLAVSALAIAAVMAAPAGASDPYRPLLGQDQPSADRIDTGAAAAYASPSRPKDRATAPLPVKRAVARAATTQSGGGSELARARKILAGLVAKHPILRGTTVEMGDARGYQAVAYYRSGRIVISRSHRASLERILNHEVWHVIDFRDNGRIDWGENVPR